MEYAYDQEVRDTALLEGETVLQLLRPGKKAFNVYRIWLPCALAVCLWVSFAVYTLLVSRQYELPLSKLFYIGGTAATALMVLLLVTVQKKQYAKKAYYMTDRRILLVGGLQSLSYQTLNYRAIGCAALKRMPLSVTFGLEAWSVKLMMNMNKRLNVKFFSISGTALPYLENAAEAYKPITALCCGKS